MEKTNPLIGEFIKKSIEYYLLSHSPIVWIDKQGKVRERKMKLADFTRQLNIPLRTVHYWMKRGRMSSRNERKLIKMGVFKFLPK